MTKLNANCGSIPTKVPTYATLVALVLPASDSESHHLFLNTYKAGIVLNLCRRALRFGNHFNAGGHARHESRVNNTGGGNGQFPLEVVHVLHESCQRTTRVMNYELCPWIPDFPSPMSIVGQTQLTILFVILRRVMDVSVVPSAKTKCSPCVELCLLFADGFVRAWFLAIESWAEGIDLDGIGRPGRCNGSMYATTLSCVSSKKLA